jgi:hypothetical protein
VESETQDRRSRPRRLKRISDVHIRLISDPIFCADIRDEARDEDFTGAGGFNMILAEKPRFKGKLKIKIVHRGCRGSELWTDPVFGSATAY